MRNTLLLAAVSIVAICAGSAAAAGPADENSAGNNRLLLAQKNAKLLWNQNSNDAGSFIDSQNYSSTFSVYDDQAADDFVIPKGHAWIITEVDVTGRYYQGSGPAASENVTFYRNKGGKPGKLVRNGTFGDINGTGGPDFALVLPGNGLKLRPGHYWVSVVANEEFDPYGAWGWETNSAQHEDQGEWENPSGGFDLCRSWEPLENCASTGPDLMFDLRGSSHRD